mmetsp:Transcript_109162/g.260460  ORF Transcript_109162/g.260460 Transcript_109162/m.260460 type:complete len:267 (-) Transcript_109162:2-802(-)
MGKRGVRHPLLLPHPLLSEHGCHLVACCRGEGGLLLRLLPGPQPELLREARLLRQNLLQGVRLPQLLLLLPHLVQGLGISVAELVRRRAGEELLLRELPAALLVHGDIGLPLQRLQPCHLLLLRLDGGHSLLRQPRAVLEELLGMQMCLVQILGLALQYHHLEIRLLQRLVRPQLSGRQVAASRPRRSLLTCRFQCCDLLERAVGDVLHVSNVRLREVKGLLQAALQAVHGLDDAFVIVDVDPSVVLHRRLLPAEGAALAEDLLDI